MKTLTRVLLVVAIVLAGFLGTWAVLQRYEDYKADQKRAELTVQSTQRAADEAAALAVSSELSAVRISHELVRQECLKGQAAYNSLSTFNQSKLQAPNCGEALKQ